MNASTCKPVKNAAVEIWHCDAGGVYSGAVANNPGTNFLRGVPEDERERRRHVQDDLPRLLPGPCGAHPRQGARRRHGRTHGAAVLPRERDERRLQEAPYSAHGTTPDTPNPNDSIFRNGGSKGLLTLKKSGAGYVGTIGMGVHLT